MIISGPRVVLIPPGAFFSRQCEFVPLSNKTTRTYFLLVLFLALRAFGNLSLAWGTKHMPETLAADPMVYIRSMLHPGIAVGVAMLVLALLVRLALLSLADLSFILPMTAIGYVLAALLGRVFLHEDVSPQRWLAVALIFGGAVLVSGTPQATTGKVEGSK
jgi:drug/metabolite transporter (DMT)-like permease